MKNLLVIFFLLLTFTSFSQHKVENPLYISLIELLANPDKYHDKKISLVGVFSYNEGESVIYLKMINIMTTLRMGLS